jgi:hypothetical protein
MQSGSLKDFGLIYSSSKGRDDSSHRILQNYSSITPYGSSDLQNVRHQASSPPSTPQTVLYRRSSDDGSLIIVVDVVALALLITATVAIILCHVARRRRHRLAKANVTITLQDVGAPPDLEAARQTNANEASTESASSSQKISLEDPSSGFVERALSAVPPPTPAARSSQSRASPQARSFIERSTAPSGSYGDSIARSARDTYRSDVQSDLSHKTSSCSNKTARLIAKFHASYFGGSYAASPTDTRSVLSRNLSKSSAFTTRTELYQISTDAPDVPVFDGKDQDVQSRHE